MPKIQFDNLPVEIARHLRRKLRKRKLTEGDLRELAKWALMEPEASDGDWWKEFGSFKLCGSSQYPKTVLKPDQVPFGIELK